ncbi:cellulose binding domain-containing protein [Sphaerisporangium dianthi]|uniref:Cellulose binding domain-containing protein n=1 Tax=Sphaerisporangium dianthi TaxID=1436120 RepID=A0ABV9CI63_9ACTN
MTTVTAHAATGCGVNYTVSSQWPGGFTANVNVDNLGDPINGWKLAWTFPSGRQVAQAWNSTVTSSGAQVTAANVSWNATIATNATVSFGFNACSTRCGPRGTRASASRSPGATTTARRPTTPSTPRG